jgi:teichuronic acid biosynthesis glycosyltransferase TuaG
MKEAVPVSVIIPCYRCKDTIERAIISVAEQTVLPREVILVDDHSDDGTLEFLQVLKEKYDSLPIIIKGLAVNRGPAYARNRGWELAVMPYIAFLDADDTWHPNKLEIQYGLMVSNAEYDICGHNRRVIKNNADNRDATNQGIYTFDAVCKSKKKIRKYYALLRNPFSTSTVMLKRDISFRFEPEKYHSEDYLLWLTCILNDLQVIYLNLNLACRFSLPYGESGLSKNLIAMQKGNLDTYSRLYRLGLLTGAEIFFCKCFSLIKFTRRCLLSLIYSISKNSA